MLPNSGGVPFTLSIARTDGSVKWGQILNAGVALAGPICFPKPKHWILHHLGVLLISLFLAKALTQQGVSGVWAVSL